MKKLFRNTLVVIMGCMSINLAMANTSGEYVFDEVCSACHSGGFKGMLSGAPEIGSSDDWDMSFVGGKEQAVVAVYNGSKNHKPMKKEAKLSEEQVADAIEYIISKTPNIKAIGQSDVTKKVEK